MRRLQIGRQGRRVLDRLSQPSSAAGLAALVREYYTAGYHAAGTRDAGQGYTPSGALIKATLIDGGVVLTGSPPAPDFHSGFGRIRLGRCRHGQPLAWRR